MAVKRIQLNLPCQIHLNLSNLYLVLLAFLNQIDLRELEHHHLRLHLRYLGFHQYQRHAFQHSNRHLHQYHCPVFHQLDHHYHCQCHRKVVQDSLKTYSQNNPVLFLKHQKFHRHPNNIPY